MKNEGERTGMLCGMGMGAGSPRRETLQEGNSSTTIPSLSVFPNPATAFATFAYTLPQVPKDAWLAVRDIASRELARIPVAQADGQAVWDTRAVAPGTYTVELMNHGASLSTAKLVVKP